MLANTVFDRSNLQLDLLRSDDKFQTSIGNRLHILLVAGPSGAGKSTLIDNLIRGRLADDHRAKLPQDLESWPCVEANDVLKRSDSTSVIEALRSERAGIILHYDTFFIHRMGLESYQQDPVSDLLFASQKLTVICIEPDPDALRLQFDRRFKEHLGKKKLGSRLWARFGRMPLKRLKYRVLGLGMPETGLLYQDPEKIETCYRNWKNFLDELKAEIPETEIFYFRPDPKRSSQRTKRFSLVNQFG